MLTSAEFQHWCQALQLTASTCQLIASLRVAPPSRRVQGRAIDLAAAPLGQHWPIRLYLHQAQAEAEALLSPVRLSPRVGDPFPDPTAHLMVNTPLVWDGRPWTVINLGERATTLVPEQGPPIQMPSAFFLQLLETGTISPLEREEVMTSPEVSRRVQEASPKDLRQANQRFGRFAQTIVVDGGREFNRGRAEVELHRGSTQTSVAPASRGRSTCIRSAPSDKCS